MMTEVQAEGLERSLGGAGCSEMKSSPGHKRTLYNDALQAKIGPAQSWWSSLLDKPGEPYSRRKDFKIRGQRAHLVGPVET